jgi:PAS domain S-box-containing protein
MSTTIGANDLQELVALCDADGIVLDWNRAAEEVTGFTRDDVAGYHVDSIVAPSSRPLLEEVLALRRTGTTVPGIDLRLQSSFGAEIPVEMTVIPRQEGGRFAGWLLIFRDTTLRVQLQEELDRMDLLYRGLVDGSPAIIYVLDADGRVVFINDAVERLLGYSRAELAGSDLIDIVVPEDRQLAYWPLRERRRASRATRNLELRLLTRGGAARRYDLDYVVVSLDSFGLRGRLPQGPAGEPVETSIGTQGIARDVTETVLLRSFARSVESILPICSVCRRIRVTTAAGEEWLPLDDYVTGKATVTFSHTLCPDHTPSNPVL